MAAKAAASQTQTKTRLNFLDNLKVALMVLVIMHHAGQAYGPGGFWHYASPERSKYLGLFFYVNASFFMGLFFFISAYFMPASLDRKGIGAFLKDRLRRFGLPLLLFVGVVNPLIMYASYSHDRGGALPFVTYLTQIYFGMGPKPANFIGPSWPDINFGHLWFVEHLLVYSLCYAAWRFFTKGWAPGRTRQSKAPSDALILAFTIGLTLISLTVRHWFPIDRWVALLGFIQMEPAHLPQYLSLFILGVTAYRQNWLLTMPATQMRRWLWIGLGGVGAVTIVSLMRWFGGMQVEPAVSGYINQTAESFMAVGLLVGLIGLFRTRFSGVGPLTPSLAASAFGAYLLHFPLVVLFNYTLAPIGGGPIVQFLLVSCATVVAAFGTSHVLRKIPGAARFL